MNCFKDARILEVTGLVGFFMKQLAEPFHIFLLIWVIVLYFVLSHTLFKIDFQYTDESLKQRIETYLIENQI